MQNRVGRKSAGERTILEEECASDKSHSAASSCKAAASVCPACSPAAGQGAEPSHANIRKINFSPQRTQRLEQKATQAIALWHFTYFWHGAGSSPLPNPAPVLEQPEKKIQTSVKSQVSQIHTAKALDSKLFMKKYNQLSAPKMILWPNRALYFLKTAIKTHRIN